MILPKGQRENLSQVLKTMPPRADFNSLGRFCEARVLPLREIRGDDGYFIYTGGQTADSPFSPYPHWRKRRVLVAEASAGWILPNK